MRRSILEIYALAVCFFAVACFVVTTGFLLWDIVRFAAPNFTIEAYTWDCHQTDEAYKECYGHLHSLTEERTGDVFPTGAALSDKRQRDYDSNLRKHKREALQGIVKSSIIVILDILIFLFHWRIAARAREHNS